MTHSGFVWECSCGHIEYGEEMPEECPECFRLESFAQLPQEIVEEREKDMSLDLETMPLGKVRSISKPSRPSKPSKPVRRKKRK